MGDYRVDVCIIVSLVIRLAFVYVSQHRGMPQGLEDRLTRWTRGSLLAPLMSHPLMWTIRSTLLQRDLTCTHAISNQIVMFAHVSTLIHIFEVNLSYLKFKKEKTIHLQSSGW